MTTRVVFEMDGHTLEGDAVMASLDASFRKFCADLAISVVPRYRTEEGLCRMMERIVKTAWIAENEILEHHALDMCIYLSPRAFAVGKHLIPATIFVIRNRYKLMAARVQVIHDESLRPLVQRSIVPEIELAKKHLFGDTLPDEADNRFAETVSQAISESYILAPRFLITSPAGHA